MPILHEAVRNDSEASHTTMPILHEAVRNDREASPILRQLRNDALKEFKTKDGHIFMNCKRGVIENHALRLAGAHTYHCNLEKAKLNVKKPTYKDVDDSRITTQVQGYKVLLNLNDCVESVTSCA
jgi:hypothetical protein